MEKINLDSAHIQTLSNIDKIKNHLFHRGVKNVTPRTVFSSLRDCLQQRVSSVVIPHSSWSSLIYFMYQWNNMTTLIRWWYLSCSLLHGKQTMVSSCMGKWLGMWMCWTVPSDPLHSIFFTGLRWQRKWTIPRLTSSTTPRGLISNLSQRFVAVIERRSWRTKRILQGNWSNVQSTWHSNKELHAHWSEAGIIWIRNQQGQQWQLAKSWQLGSEDSREALFNKASILNHPQQSWFDEGKSHELQPKDCLCCSTYSSQRDFSLGNYVAQRISIWLWDGHVLCK